MDVPYIRVDPDLDKAAKYGLKPGDIRRAAATIVAGDEVSDLHVDNKVYDIIAWSVPEARRDVQSIRDLPLDTPGGGHVKMSQVADVSVRPTPNRISREDNSRRIDVGMNVRGRDLGSVVVGCEGPAPGRAVPPRVPRRGPGRVRRAPERAGEAVRLWPGGRARHLPAPPDVHRKLAGGRLLVPDAAARAGRRRAGGVRGGRADLARLAGRLPHGVRHRGPKRHPARQPLPAPRGRGGPAVRDRASCCAALASGSRRSS